MVNPCQRNRLPCTTCQRDGRDAGVTMTWCRRPRAVLAPSAEPLPARPQRREL